ncbi:hypothetical protein SAMN04487950_0415 [Halogranum rubrum]|uniref:Uncharacterized protein n=1 Tax=Halogranum rubrum TaxID=553466 RepID=A0A1I4BBT0_9EURY|nr:hypothetical protein [Halogranum rubrum]SFK65509.1 hypothetical protein SAMN04487950_0415 [Halogranum rubrum]
MIILSVGSELVPYKDCSNKTYIMARTRLSIVTGSSYLNKTSKLVATLGFLGISLSVISARLRPTTGYETNIYLDAGVIFWIGLVFVLLSAVWLLFYSNHPSVGAFFALCAPILIAGIPIFRGMEYVGYFDAMVHLGWVQDLIAGEQILSWTLYPAYPILVLAWTRVLEVSPQYALLLTVSVGYLVYATSTISISKRLVNANIPIRGVYFLPMLFLPIIPINLPRLAPLPTVFGLLFGSSIVLYGMIHTQSVSNKHAPGLLVLLIALSLIHPQQALVGFGLLAGIATVWGHRSTRRYSIIFAAAIFLTWFLLGRPGFIGATQSLVGAIVTTSSTTVGPGAGATTALGALGGSLVEIGVKVLGVSVVVAIVALTTLKTDVLPVILNNQDPYKRLITGIAIGLIPTFGLFAVTLVVEGDLAQALRYVGVMLAYGGCLAIVQLARFRQWANERISKRHLRVIGTIVVVIAIVVSVPVAYKSPYMYKPSPENSESQFKGYETAFKYQSERPMVSTATNVYRYQTAIYGASRSRYGHGGVRPISSRVNPPDISKNSGGFFKSYVPNHYRNLSSVLPESSYLVVTEYARGRHVELYQGLRYSKSDFDSLERHDKVVSTGEFELYLVDTHNSTSRRSI